MTKISSIQEIQIHYCNIASKSIAIQNSKQAFEVFKEIFDDNTITFQEEFKVLYLNRANKVIGVYQGFKGGIIGVVVDTRIIFSIALKCLAVTIIVAHNHPSGNLNPSEEDIDLTRKLKSAGKFLDINVLDHLILTPQGEYLSFADEGMI